MKKTLPLLSLLCLFILNACSSSDPWTGEWQTSSGTPTNLILNKNGAAIQTFSGDDGTWAIYGYWEKADDQGSTIKIVFDPNTIKTNLDNPIKTAFVKQGLILMAEETRQRPLIMTMSEDKKYMGVKDKPEGFTKISSSTGKFSNVKPARILNSGSIESEEDNPYSDYDAEDSLVVETVVL